MSQFYYSNACSRYGASMGRRDDKPADDTPIRAWMQRVPLDQGGYDPGGAYWGIGKPLYRVEAECTEETYTWHFRADSRADAERQLSEAFPLAKFRRLCGGK